ncbi:hypothetical protein V8F06_004982 [Rhypophila decipiens]
MAQAWLTLPDWELSNVQAVLAFIINILCAFGIWAVSHVLWKSAATAISRGQKTKLLSLLTLGTLGDVLDTIPLLRADLGTSLLSKLIFQCAVVTILSLTAIVSGPIARYSTSSGTAIRLLPVNGSMATSNFHSMNSAQVKWNNTIERLNAANFPLDQLLDFWPRFDAPWKFNPSQWNSTWTVNCTFTPGPQSITLVAVKNYTEPILDEIPGMASVFPAEMLTPGHTITSSMSGAWEQGDDPNSNEGIWKDMLYFVFIQSNPNTAYSDEPDPGTTGRQLNYLPFNIYFAVFHLHGAPSTVTETRSFDIGIGPIAQSRYTMADCQLYRLPSRTPDKLDEDTDWHVAFPWSADPLALPSAFAEYYRAEIMDASFTGREVHLPSGEEVVRLYQAYLVSKDTEYHETVSRELDVEVRTVRLSVVALVLFLGFALLLAVGLGWSVCFKLLVGAGTRRKRGTEVVLLEEVPKTKVDWTMRVVYYDNTTEGGTLKHNRAGLRAAFYEDGGRRAEVAVRVPTADTVSTGKGDVEVIHGDPSEKGDDIKRHRFVDEEKGA